MSLQGKTVFITGGSRGIGKAMALKLAGAGANIVIAAKSVQEDPRLGGTIFSAAAEVEALGVKALAVQVDIRDEAQIAEAMKQTVEKFGGIDIVINNASAIQLTDTANTPSKRFDLMHSINVRGTFLVVQHALPYLKKSSHAHILTLSPPINLTPKWLGPHVAYTLSKYDMSMLTLGWAEEFKEDPNAFHIRRASWDLKRELITRDLTTRRIEYDEAMTNYKRDKKAYEHKVQQQMLKWKLTII